MGPGFRYHVATIAAVFLALGVGVVVGSSFVQSAIVQKQTQQLADLRTQFKTVIVPLKDQNQHYADLVSAIFPLVASAHGPDTRVVIIQTGDYPDTARSVRDTLVRAGATVTGLVTLDRGFAAKSEGVLQDLVSRLHTTHPTLTPDTQSLFHVLAAAVTRGNSTADVAALRAVGLLEADGDLSEPAEFAVLIGGADLEHGSRASAVDLPLIVELRKLPARVIEVEPQGAEISYIGSLRDVGITTIDDVDTDIGGLSLLLALHSPVGDYGTKPTAGSGIAPVASGPG